MSIDADDGWDALVADVRRLREMLAASHLEPDPARLDWADRAGALDEVSRIAEEQLPSALERLERKSDDAGVIRKGRLRVAEALAEASALLYAANRSAEAVAIVRRARTCCGEGDLAAELRAGASAPAEHAALIHARWLHRHRKWRRAAAVARRIVDSPWPALARPARGMVHAGLWYRIAVVLFAVSFAFYFAYEVVSALRI